MRVDFTNALNVVERSSLEAPHEDPAIDFKMATFWRALSATALQCGAKELLTRSNSSTEVRRIKKEKEKEKEKTLMRRNRDPGQAAGA